LPAATISVLVLTPVPVAGDYDRNGIVDASDYVLWRKTKNQSGANLAADGNHNNLVDNPDYTYWRNRFGRNTNPVGGASASAIPEPPGCFLLLSAVLLLMISRNRIQHRQPIEVGQALRS
jgi:hypothetical protein